MLARRGQHVRHNRFHRLPSSKYTTNGIFCRLDGRMLRTTYYQRVEKSLRYNRTYFTAYLDFLEGDSSIILPSKWVYLSRINVFLKMLDKLEIDIEDLTSIDQIAENAKRHGRDLDVAFKAALKLFFSIARRTTNIQITDEEIER